MSGALLAALGCSEEWVRPNFVLIVVDTLRADRLHFAGYARENTPGFDALRAESVWFEHAYAPSSWTLPSTVSLFLSQMSSEHGVVSWGSELEPEQTSLVEVLRDAGYRTAGWTANRLLVGSRGFGQGFDEYALVMNEKWRRGMPKFGEHSFATAQQLNEKALAWLRELRTAERGANFFLYLHYMEPHTPFLCPDGAGEPCKRASTELNRKLVMVQWDFVGEQRRLISGFYDADVARIDAEIPHLLRGLQATGALDDTWVIVTSDHGEMLGEHGVYVHGNTLYEPVLRVPLLFRPPSGGSGLVEVPVSLIDVAPTIADLARVASPPSFRGRSLAGALGGDPLAARPLVAELVPAEREPRATQRHLLTVIDGGTKLVERIDGTLQRFSLANGSEAVDPAPASEAELEALITEAGVVVERERAHGAESPELTPEVREQLEALGYLP